MSEPVISRRRPYYRVKFNTPSGLRGIDDGNWILDKDQPARMGEAPGVTKPTAFNTGTLFSRSRTLYVGSSLLTQSNKIYRDMDFHEYLKVQAPGVQFINCAFYGSTAWPSAAQPLVECLNGVDAQVTSGNPWAGLPYFEGCTFKPQRPNYFTDGIHGSFVALECSFLRLRNGVTINSPDNTKRARAKLLACYISDLAFWYPLPTGSPVSNNGVNIVAGGDIQVIGNYIRATAYRGDDRNFVDPDGTAIGGSLSYFNPSAMDAFTQANGPHANGAGIRVTQTRSIAQDASMVIENNWLSHGMLGADLINGTYRFANNKFKLLGFYQRAGVNTQWYIKLAFPTTSTINGLGTNVFEDNGQLLTTSNGGIQ